MTTRFEDRLLDQLSAVVAANPAPERSNPTRRVRVAASGAVGLATAAATVAIISTTGGAAAAYAVTPNADGTVTVHVSSLSDAAGLQSALRADGIPAVVSYGETSLDRCAPPPGAVIEKGTATGGGPAPPPTPSGGHGEQFGLSEVTGSSGPGGTINRTSVRVGVGEDGVTFSIDPGTLQPGEQVYISTSTGTLQRLGVAFGTKTASGCIAPPSDG